MKGDHNRVISRDAWPRIVELRRQEIPYEEIAQLFGVTRERIRQIIKLTATELIRYYSYGTATCLNCKKQNAKGEMYKIFPAFALSQNIILCKKCWKPYCQYRRFKHTVAAYQERYDFVLEGIDSGVQAYILGWLWKDELPPDMRLGDTCRSEMVWSHRIREFYELAVARVRKLEQKHAWLTTCYEELKTEDTQK